MTFTNACKEFSRLVYQTYDIGKSFRIKKKIFKSYEKYNFVHRYIIDIFVLYN